MSSVVLHTLRMLGQVMIPEARKQEITAGAADYLAQAVSPEQGPHPRAVWETFVNGTCALPPGVPFELVLRPPAANDPLAAGCRDSTVFDRPVWQETADELNTQFAEYGIAIRIVLGSVSGASTAPCSTSVPVVSCTQEIPPEADGAYSHMKVGGPGVSAEFGTLAVKESASASTRAHELAHVLGATHWAPRARQRDVGEFGCEGSRIAPGSNMHYENDCRDAGFVFGDARDLHAGLGVLDLHALKVATARAEDRQEATQQSAEALFDQIALASCARVAGFFVAAVAAKLVERGLKNAAIRCTEPGPKRERALAAASVVGTLVRTAVVQANLGLGYISVAAVLGGTAASMGFIHVGPLGRTVRAAADAIQDANLAPVLFGIACDRDWGLGALVASVAGETAGNAVAAVFEAIQQRCRPLSNADRQAMREDLDKTVDAPVACYLEGAANCMASMGGCPERAAAWISSFDRAMAHAIQSCLTLGVLVSHVHVEDQRLAQAQGDLAALADRARREAADQAAAVEVPQEQPVAVEMAEVPREPALRAERPAPAAEDRAIADARPPAGAAQPAPAADAPDDDANIVVRVHRGENAENPFA